MRSVLQICVVYTGLMFGANTVAAADLDALRQGDMRKLALHATPQPVSDIVFHDLSGRTFTLADWQGKVTLVNFWATWCAPCRKEMPALDALQLRLGGPEFEVVTIATGRNSPEGITRFFTEASVTNLPSMIDQKSALGRAMGVLGLPVTVILDRSGAELGRLTGEADWNSPEAVALMEALIAAP